MYLVKLVKPSIVNDFRSDYFSRRFHDKKDAQQLVYGVRRKGGDAEIVQEGRQGGQS